MLERIHQRSTRVMNGLEHLSYEERPGTVWPGEKKAQGKWHQCKSIPGGRAQRGWSPTLFSGAQWQEQRQWAQAETRGCFLNMRSAGVTKHCGHKLPMDVVQSPSLEIFQSHLQMVLGRPALGGLAKNETRWSLNVPPTSTIVWCWDWNGQHFFKVYINCK